MQKFEKIFLEITNFCGINCSFCTPVKSKDSTAMPLALFAKIIEQITPFTKRCALHILGDPLSVKNLESYLQIATLPLEITTSGFYPQKLESLLNYKNIKQINISLTSALYQQKEINLDSYLSPIFDLCATHAKIKSEAFINLRLWNLDSKTLNHPPQNKEIYTKLQDFFKVQIPQSTRLAYKIHLSLKPFFSWNPAPTPQNAGFCFGGIKQLGILQNGLVIPCCFDTNANINLGDLNTQDFVQILNSPRLKRLVQGFRDNKRVESYCKFCTYPNYLHL